MASMMKPISFDPSMERPEEGEPATGATLDRALRDIVETTQKDLRHGDRALHAKSHALVSGSLTVRPNLPPELAQGVFAEPKTYPMVMRFSTVPGDRLPDSVSVPRGLALKVIGVEGARLAGSEPDSTQDFLMVDGPAFASPTGKGFVEMIKLLAKTTDKMQWLKVALAGVFRGLEAALESVGKENPLFVLLGGHAPINPAGAVYYSQTPYRYGDFVAKFSVAPLSDNLLALKKKPVDLDSSPDALREDMTRLFSSGESHWEFRVQLMTDPESMPIENSALVWPEDKSPFVPVATLSIPPQPAWSEGRAKVGDDGLAFNPWHGLQAHQPLGSVNRLRKAAYRMSSSQREQFNRCPLHEPKGPVDLPK